MKKQYVLSEAELKILTDGVRVKTSTNPKGVIEKHLIVDGYDVIFEDLKERNIHMTREEWDLFVETLEVGGL